MLGKCPRERDRALIFIMSKYSCRSNFSWLAPCDEANEERRELPEGQGETQVRNEVADQLQLFPNGTATTRGTRKTGGVAPPVSVKA